MSLVGRTRILNAYFYGKLRFYMWTLNFPSWLTKALETDAPHFLWKSNPKINTNELGTASQNGKYISKQATFRALEKGGAGQLHLPSHIEAIHASWILRYLHPRKAQWKQVLDAWIGIPRYALLHSTSAEQRQLLERIPEVHHFIHQAIRAFWDLNLKMSETFVKTKGQPDLIRAIPLANNNFFQIRKPKLAKLRAINILRIDDLFGEDARRYF
eukprot:1742995-Pleurochrysis_carterae.AAC.1